MLDEGPTSGHRYIVCLNEEERRKDAHDRVAIVAHLREELKRGTKRLVGNKGYRRYVKVKGAGRFDVDESLVEQDARFDGIWVLRTNTDYDAETVALAYKSFRPRSGNLADPVRIGNVLAQPPRAVVTCV